MQAHVQGQGTLTEGTTDAAAPVAPVEARISDAALRCISECGVSGLVLDDVARSAGCGRATVYRAFPDGRAGVIEAAVETEVGRFTAAVGAGLDAAESLEELLTAALVGTARFVGASAPLAYLMANEPSVVLAHMAFDQSPVVFDAAHRLLAPHLGRFLPPVQVAPTAEWLARVGASYLLLPFPGIDLADPASARRIVSTFLLPGLGQEFDPSADASPVAAIASPLSD